MRLALRGDCGGMSPRAAYREQPSESSLPCADQLSNCRVGGALSYQTRDIRFDNQQPDVWGSIGTSGLTTDDAEIIHSSQAGEPENEETESVLVSALCFRSTVNNSGHDPADFTESHD